MTHSVIRAALAARHMSIVAAALAGAMAFAAPASAAVVIGDTFAYSVTGFDSTSTTGYYLVGANGPLTATFGTTSTITGGGYAGQNITISSSETISGGNTTDRFTISTPTNFLAASTVSGTTISQLYFDIGGFDAGTNTVDFLLPIPATYTTAANVVYGTANTSFALTPFTQLSNGNKSLAEDAGVNTGTSAIFGVGVHSFTYSITYATPVAAAVPEPATWAMMIGGFGLVGAAARRRRTRTTVTYA